MAISAKDRNTNRQWILSATQEFSVSQLENGKAVATVKMPYGARVIGGGLIVTEVFNSTSTDTVNIGDGALATRYGSAVNLRTLGWTALTVSGYKYNTIDFIDLVWTSGGGTPTTGKGILVVNYLVDGKQNEIVPDYDLV